MIKQITVTFDFDPETELTSNIHTFINGVEKKKKTTKKVVKDEVLEESPIIIREENRLVFNNKCYADMELDAEYRIIIKYEKVGKEKFPLIGTDIAFDEEGSGNKVSKTKTVPYRGKANTILSEFGTEFTIEPYKDGIWKMVSTIPVEPKTYEEAVQTAENLDVEILTEDDNTTEIEELTFKL